MRRKVVLTALVVVVLLLVATVIGLSLRRETQLEQERVPTPQETRILRLKHAVADNPTHYDTRLRLAYAYQQQEKYPEALEQYDIIIKRRPRSMAALYYRGLIYREMGADPQAMDSFRAVLNIKDDHVLATIALGHYYLESRDFDKLFSVVKPTVTKHPEVAELQYLMGRGNEALGRFDRAKVRYRNAVTYAPDMVDARRRLERLERREAGEGEFPPKRSLAATSTTPTAP